MPTKSAGNRKIVGKSPVGSPTQDLREISPESTQVAAEQTRDGSELSLSVAELREITQKKDWNTLGDELLDKRAVVLTTANFNRMFGELQLYREMQQAAEERGGFWVMLQHSKKYALALDLLERLFATLEGVAPYRDDIVAFARKASEVGDLLAAGGPANAIKASTKALKIFGDGQALWGKIQPGLDFEPIRSIDRAQLAELFADLNDRFLEVAALFGDLGIFKTEYLPLNPSELPAQTN